MGVLRQAGKACLAEETAALNSSFVVKGTWETTSCVAYNKVANCLDKFLTKCLKKPSIRTL